jgi:IclR family acetate operon transcriptional repressor
VQYTPFAPSLQLVSFGNAVWCWFVPHKNEQDKRYEVQSVARAAALLDLVGDAGADGLGVTQIAGHLEVAKSTALSLARTLTTAGLLRAVEPGPRYMLGLNLLRLGDLVGQQMSIAELGLSTLRDLSSVTGLTARLAMNENGYPVFLERIDGEGSIRFHAPLGQREKPHATAAGKAILAEMSEDDVRSLISEAGMAVHTSQTLTNIDHLLEDLSRVRVEGYATDDEEEAEGVFCVGAAFFDHLGTCAGALSITGLKVDVPQREMPRLGEIVKVHSDRITLLLGGIGQRSRTRRPSSFVLQEQSR